MFRGKILKKGASKTSRGTHQSSSSKLRGADRGDSGSIRKKSSKPRALSPTKKLEHLRLKLAAKGIQFDQRHIQKKNNSLADVVLYKQKLSITPDPERKCTENEIDKIQDAILNSLEPLEDGCFPQFYGSYTVKGVLVMSCANEETKLWLERTVPKLQPWENAQLCVKPKGEVSQGTKVLFKTPKLFAKTDHKKILQMLSTQNITVETKMWKNVGAKSEDTGQTLTFVVDNQSLEAIRALNNKLFLGLGSVEVVILNDEGEGKKQDSADTDTKREDESDKKTTEADDNQTSLDTEMKDQVEDDKKTAEDTEMKNEDDMKKTSEDEEMKRLEEDDKQTSADTEMTPSERTSV